MELKINGNIISKTIIKSRTEEYRYKIIEDKTSKIKYGILKTHIDTEKNEILDYFDYKEKNEAESFINTECDKAKSEGFEITRETLTENEQLPKHYIFSDDSKAITYEDDYATIEEAQAFNDLLIRQFGKNFTFTQA